MSACGAGTGRAVAAGGGGRRRRGAAVRGARVPERASPSARHGCSMRAWATVVAAAALLALAAAAARRPDQDFEFDDDAVSAQRLAPTLDARRGSKSLRICTADPCYVDTGA